MPRGTTLAHLVWADNFLLASDTREGLELMISMLTDKIQSDGFQWKLASAEVLTTHSGPSEPLQLRVDGTVHPVPFVESMLVLGSLITNFDRGGRS